ncbi:MAG TPA: hypothetical protein VD931_21550 [Baekduia sp.]|nr:hypothetical protein [Baekduia sp.]
MTARQDLDHRVEQAVRALRERRRHQAEARRRSALAAARVASPRAETRLRTTSS